MHTCARSWASSLGRSYNLENSPRENDLSVHSTHSRMVSTSLPSHLPELGLAFHHTLGSHLFLHRSICDSTSPRRPFSLPTPCTLPSRNVPHTVYDNSSKTSWSIQNSQTSSSSEGSPSSTERPNAKKYNSQRSLITSGKNDVTPEEINDLLARAGKAVCYNKHDKLRSSDFLLWYYPLLLHAF